MKLEGDLQQIDLVRQLVELAETRFTGAMRFEHDGIIKILYFKEGDVLSASTNDRADSVDEILLRAGKVSRDHIRQALGKRKENETLGDALLSLGFISRKELSWARRVQIIGILRSLQAWNAGSFQLVQDYLPKREEGGAFPIPQIVLELTVTDPDRAHVERELGGGEAVLRKGPAFEQRYAKLSLNEDADAIVAQIDGVKSAAEISAATQLEAFAVYKLLLALRKLDLLVDAKPKAEHEVVPGTPAGILPGVLPDPAFEPLPPLDLHVDEPPSPEPEKWDLTPEEGEAIPSLPADQEGWLAPSTEAPPAVESDADLARRSSRNSILLLVSLLVVLALGAWGGYRWWQRGGEGDAAGSPLPPPEPEAAAAAADRAPVPAAEGEPAGSAPAGGPSDSTSEPAERGARSESAAAPPTSAAAAPPPAVDADDPLRRRYQSMAERWAVENRNVPFTVQFEIVCQTESVTRALADGGDRVWFVPIRYRGAPCFRVFWGTYSSREAAEAARREIPAALRGSGPVVVQPREILR